jgi:hypothetical protein
MLKEINCQTRILYLEKESLTNIRRNKIFPGKGKTEETGHNWIKIFKPVVYLEVKV